MHVPTADELAAIAAAYLVVTERSEPPVRSLSRWALAGRIETDPEAVRNSGAATRRWETAARLAL